MTRNQHAELVNSVLEMIEKLQSRFGELCDMPLEHHILMIMYVGKYGR